MEELTAWGVLTDFGIISILLLIGVFIRTKVVFVQRSFMPASIIAGFIGLIFGPYLLDWIPFSNFIGSYPGVLIAVVFASLPFSTGSFKWSEVFNKVGGLWSYSQVIMLLFWGLGLAFSLVLLGPLFGVHDGFGLLLAAGFVGGHGTAAAIGDAFAQLGWEDATSIAMTSATIGILSAVIVGLLLIRHAANKGYANYLSSFDDLPKGLRTGLLDKKDADSLGEGRVSSIMIDPLIFHVIFVITATLLGYWLSNLGSQIFESVTIPAFSLAFIVALIIRIILEKTGADKYLDKRTMTNVSGTATDFLVAFGIASINLTVVAQNLTAFILLMAFGILLALFFYRFFSSLFFQDHWFEKGIFTFGWITGAVVTAIALIRISDPKLESQVIDDFGLAYVPIAPVEIAIITFSPWFIMQGLPWWWVLILVVSALAIMIFSRTRGWITINNR